MVLISVIVQLYGRWFSKHSGIEPEITEFRVLGDRCFPHSREQRDHFDLFVFTGSRFGVYDRTSQSFARCFDQLTSQSESPFLLVLVFISLPFLGLQSSLEEEWIAEATEFVRTLECERRRMIGICFGHQLIAHAFQGMVRHHSFHFVSFIYNRLCVIA